jgi:hypothetical protein
MDGDVMARLSHLWSAGQRRWVIWRDGSSPVVFDRHLNRPLDLDEHVRREVVHRMRQADIDETDSYPGRACSA